MGTCCALFGKASTGLFLLTSSNRAEQGPTPRTSPPGDALASWAILLCNTVRFLFYILDNLLVAQYCEILRTF